MRPIQFKLRSYLLFIILTLVATNCDQEDTEPDFEPRERTVRYLKGNEIPNIVGHLYQSVNPGNNRPYSMNHGSLSTDLGEINMERIMEVIDTLNNTNYTFSISDDDNDPFTFTNLVIKKRENGDFDHPFLLRYTPDSSYVDQFISDGFSLRNFTGTISKSYLNLNNYNNGYQASLENKRSSISEICSEDTYISGGGGGENTTTSTDGGGSLSGLAIPTDCIATVVGYTVSSGPKFRPWDFVWSEMYSGEPIIAWVCSDTYEFELNDGDCPDSESEEIGVVFDGFEEYIQNLRLNSIYLTPDPGLVPQWLWQSGYVSPYLAGFVDGMWETIESTWGIAQWLTYVTSVYPSAEAIEARRQTWQFIRFLNDLVTNPTARQQAWDSLKETFLSYIDETVAFTPQAQYNQGKLLFDVAGLFVGPGAFKLAMKGESFIQNLIRILRLLPESATRSIISAKNAGLDAVKTTGRVTIKSPGSVDEIADFSEFATTISRHRMLAKEGSVVFKKADEVNGYLSQWGYTHPPFKETVTEFVTDRPEVFVRFHDINNRFGPWVMKESDVKHLTENQIRELFAIPSGNAIPRVSYIDVPPGIKLFSGTANEYAPYSGGGLQFFIDRGQFANTFIPESWFISEMPIRTFLGN